MRVSSIRALLPSLIALGVLGCDALKGLLHEGPEAVSARAPVEPAPLATPSSAPPALPVATLAPAAVAAEPQVANVAPEAPKEPVLELSAGAAAAGVTLNQLRILPAPTAPAAVSTASATKPGAKTAKPPAWHEVTVYAVFGAPFSRRVELRAQGADHAELGRSEREAALSQPRDSARYLTFRFDPRTQLEQVRFFVAYVDPEGVPAPPPGSATPAPRPEPQPQFIRPVRPGLVPKDP